MADFYDFEFEETVRSVGRSSAKTDQTPKRTTASPSTANPQRTTERPSRKGPAQSAGKKRPRKSGRPAVDQSGMRFTLPVVICGVVMLVLVLWLAIWLISSTLIGTKQSSVSKEALTANVQTLIMLEQQEPANIAALNEEKQNADTLAENSTVHVEDEDQEDEQTHIMEMDNPSMSTLLSWFDGTAVVGDSIVEGVSAYQFLNDSIVFGKIGVSVSGADDLISAMTAVYPRKVFLAFGLNDMANYGSDVDKFIEHYTTMIGTIREALPTAGIYVVAVLPVQDKAISKQSKLANVDLYNEKLEEMCNDLEIAFLNPGFILEQDSSFYDADGMHPKGNFYYKWLTYLADMAGISE